MTTGLLILAIISVSLNLYLLRKKRLAESDSSNAENAFKELLSLYKRDLLMKEDEIKYLRELDTKN